MMFSVLTGVCWAHADRCWPSGWPAECTWHQLCCGKPDFGMLCKSLHTNALLYITLCVWQSAQSSYTIKTVSYVKWIILFQKWECIFFRILEYPDQLLNHYKRNSLTFCKHHVLRADFSVYRILSSTPPVTVDWWGLRGCSLLQTTAPSCEWKLWRWLCPLSKEPLTLTSTKKSIANSPKPQGNFKAFRHFLFFT